MKKEIPLMYKVYHDKLKESCDLEGDISKRDAVFILTNIFRVPRDMRYPILKELEDFDLIINCSRNFVKVK